MRGIYKIKCLINNLLYIGYTNNFIKRKLDYKNLNCKSQKLLLESLLKYGWENHKFEIIEECSIELLKEKEKYWIKFYNSFENGLNDNRGGGGPLVHSLETKLKISEISKLNKGKRAVSHRKGKTLPEEHVLNNKLNKGKRAVSHRKGKTLPEEHRKRISEGNKGKLKPTIATPIYQYDLEGNFIKEYYAIEEAGRQLELNPTAINNCLLKNKNLINKKPYTSGGYIWYYKNLNEENVDIP